MTHSPQVLDHFENPRNAGELPLPAFSAEVSNPACGDVLRLYAQVENGALTAVKFKATGCTAAIACGSVLTEMITGVPVAMARNLTAPMIADTLGGLPDTTVHASQLALDALTALLGKISEGNR